MTWRTVSPIPVKRRVRFRKSGMTYTDKNTQADLKRVADSYDGQLYGKEPLVLIVEVFQQLPESKRKKFVREPFTIKPDIDNILKAVMDGLIGRAYVDDKQIVFTAVRKHDRTADISGEYVRYLVEPEEDYRNGIR